MPICNECLKHRNKYKWLLVLICSISIIIGGMVFAILTASEIDGFLNFIFSVGSVITTYYIVSAIWKTKPLSKEHSSRGKSASIFSPFFNRVVTFTFSNWEYAQLFQEANSDIAGDVHEIAETNTAKPTSVLKANEHPVATVFASIGIFIVIAIIIASAFDSSSSDYSGSSSLNKGSTTSSSQYSNGNYNNYEYDYDNDYTVPDFDSGDSIKANQLKSELEDLKDEIDNMESELNSLKDDIDYYENQYYISGYDFYVDYYNDAEKL